MSLEKYEFTFDAPRGIYSCPKFTHELLLAAEGSADQPQYKVGELVNVVGIISELPYATIVNPTIRELVAQAAAFFRVVDARWLDLELHVLVPTDFGRVQKVRWEIKRG